MTGVERFDAWLGRTMFVPLVVRVCQLTRQTQYAVSRLFWFIAALDGFYRAESALTSVLFGVISLMMAVSASLRADSPTRSFLWFRLMAVAFFLLDLLDSLATGEWAGIEFWVLVLIAEYASTIRTIPPRQTKTEGRAEASRQTG
jgi:hypothetical protein